MVDAFEVDVSVALAIVVPVTGMLVDTSNIIIRIIMVHAEHAS